MSDVKPVWITADDLAQRRARIEYIVQSASSQRVRNAARALLVLQQEQESAWDAAPADAEGEIARAHAISQRSSLTVRASDRSLAHTLLRALGMPGE